MGIRDILNSDFVLFGGKGGVGKTTCAAATALVQHPRRTLVASADPAHSLGDCLGQAVGDEIVQVDQAANLYALEISAEKTLERFRIDYKSQMRRLLETSAGIEHLTVGERERLLSLPVSGADEVMGLKHLMDVMDEGDFDKCIVDTAPTGHALRLLSMPDIFDKWIGVFYALREKHRFHERAFSRPDRADEFLASLKTSSARLRNLLRAEKSEFVVVAAAERLVIEETKDLVKELLSFGIPVKHLIVNKLFPDLDGDFARARRDEEQKLLETVRETFDYLEVTEVELQPTGPSGIENLRRFAGVLYG